MTLFDDNSDRDNNLDYVFKKAKTSDLWFESILNRENFNLWTSPSTFSATVSLKNILQILS